MKTFYTIALIILCIGALIYFVYTSTVPAFTADIDGIVFKADGWGASYSAGRLKINGRHAAPDTTYVMIDLNAAKVGTYLLNDDDPATGNVAAYFIGKTVFATTRRFTGSVAITELDLEGKKVSGTFAFQGVQVVPQGPTVVNVTDGEFKRIPIGIR